MSRAASPSGSAGAGAFAIRLVGFLVLALAITVALSGPVAEAVDRLLDARPDLARVLGISARDGVWDFGRVFRRLGMIVVVVAAWLLRGRLARAFPAERRPSARPVRDLAWGLTLGVTTFAGLIVALVATDVIDGRVPPPESWLASVASALAAGLVVGAIEEGVLRGWLQARLQRLTGSAVAIVAIAVPYSLLHYFRAKVPVADEPGPSVGVRALAAHAEAMLDPAVAAPALGLLLVGIVLGIAYAREGSLPFVIGVHAGWVATIGLGQDVFGRALHTTGLWGPGGVLGSPWAWVALILMIPLLRIRPPALFASGATARPDGGAR